MTKCIQTLDIEDAFINACYLGNLDTVLQLKNKFPNLNIRAKNDEAFRLACENGHVNIVSQLYSWDKYIDISCLKNFNSLPQIIKAFIITDMYYENSY